MKPLVETTCPSCGSSNPEPHLDAKDPYDRGRSWRLVKCRAVDCGFVFLNPRPRPEDLGEFYGESYYSYQPSSESGTGRRLKDWIRRQVIEGRELSRRPGSLDPLRLHKRVLYCMLRRRLRFVDAPSPGRLLDIGCGSGAFLLHNAEYGWECHGADVDSVAVQRANAAGLPNVRCGDLVSLEFPESFFDRITFSHSLEHIYNPLETLRVVARILKPGGDCWIWVPNFGSGERIAYGSCWRALDPPRHLSHFTLDTLGRLLRQAGLEVVTLRTLGGGSERRESWRMMGEAGATAPRKLYSAAQAGLLSLLDGKKGFQILAVGRRGNF